MMDTSYVRLLCKRILCEGVQLLDDRARTYILNRTRNAFQSYRQCTDETRTKNKCREAPKQLHRLERVNRGDLKSGLKILEFAYGIRGKTRHRLLHPYVHTHLPAELPVPESLVPNVPHTAPPPPLCPPLAAIIRLSLGKNLEPELPKPEFKPLHPGRQANLLWRWRSDLLARVQLPLPLEIIRELEQKAGATNENAMSGGP
ncbi:hypothetical protein K492DRAFT_182412 [Lichtheimia hyalospora FSU 10163]|nr:hypothetical protein K492DRAFT_182412 [Lichtheimia hyalospora FSU 10163]